MLLSDLRRRRFPLNSGRRWKIPSQCIFPICIPFRQILLVSRPYLCQRVLRITMALNFLLAYSLWLRIFARIDCLKLGKLSNKNYYDCPRHYFVRSRDFFLRLYGNYCVAENHQRYYFRALCCGDCVRGLSYTARVCKISGECRTCKGASAVADNGTEPKKYCAMEYHFGARGFG